MARFNRKKTLLSIGVLVTVLFFIFVWNNRQQTSKLPTATVNLLATDSKQPSSANVDQPKTGSTGVVFSGRAVRKFPVDKLKFASFKMVHNSIGRRSNPRCERWAVLTTIFKPSEAVRRQVRLKGWCLVIVGDRKSPLKYETGWISGEGNDAVVYLTPDEQQAMNNPFVDALPWNHFGRKNIGYLFAIAHGAEVIWDFDDDNMLKFFIEGAAPPGAPSIAGAIPAEEENVMNVRIPHNHTHPTYNPYPVLGAPSLPSWPRGLPLADIKVAGSYSSVLKNIQLSKESIAVLQSLADYQPDVDAIYRITMPVPFFFNRMSETKPLMVPTGVLTPYNAQATLHFKNSFWALLLPVTVHGRVSDIWRSYFAQRIFWDTGLQVGFMARPLVVQDRNPHSNLGDLDGERDLYMKSEHLVKLLGSWKGKETTLVGRIEELWVTLYEHQYIELHDVELVQLWIQTLLNVGYTFPKLKSVQTLVPSYPKARSMQRTNDDVCETTSSLTFWTSDLHDGTRIDMPSVLASLGHKVIVSGRKNSSPYPFVFKMNGISQYLLERSDVITNLYLTHSTRLTEQMLQDNFEFYKNNDQIASVDAFLCQFPASMCELWMPFNKTIVYLPAHRYNLGRCTANEWKRLNDHLYMLSSMESPRHVIGALSVYDQEYLHHYTGLDPIPLFSFSGFYTANNPYAPKRDEILLFGTEPNSWSQGIPNLKSLNIIKVKTLYRHYDLLDLVNHRAVVFIPYSVMSYKLTELYSLAIPLFMPSMRFYRNVQHLGPDRSSLSIFYCRNKTLDGQIKPHPSSTHPYSPNLEVDDDAEAEFYWLQFSDFYQWPHITYFDNIEDLERKLKVADFDRIHKLMVVENERRKKELLYNWCRATKNIQTGRKVPLNYDLALKKLYNTKRLQVY